MEIRRKETIVFAGRAISAMSVGVLVMAEILRRSRGKRTPQQSGGWASISTSEYEIEGGNEVLASVAPICRGVREVIDEQPSMPAIIDISDIPQGVPQPAKLSVVPHLIDIEDIPQHDSIR